MWSVDTARAWPSLSLNTLPGPQIDANHTPDSWDDLVHEVYLGRWAFRATGAGVLLTLSHL